MANSKTVRIFVSVVSKTPKTVRLYVKGAYNSYAWLVTVDAYIELCAEFRSFKRHLEKDHGLKVDVRKPNLFAAFHNSRPAPPPPPPPLSELKPPEKKEPGFEVNLTEALVGWKGWSVRDLTASVNGVQENLTKVLVSTNDCIWMPDEPVVAKCTGGVYGGRHHMSIPAPVETCTCGFYAADQRGTAQGYGKILGTVYGWGRYVRYTGGWRAQYAYPKSFLLREEQIGLIDMLRQYHVPIYVEQPQMVYSPEEDGYEHRGEEAHWDSGANPEPDPEEEDDED